MEKVIKSAHSYKAKHEVKLRLFLLIRKKLRVLSLITKGVGWKGRDGGRH